MMKCSACSVEFANGLVQCPECGKKNSKPISIIKLIGLGFFALIAYMVVFVPRSPVQPPLDAAANLANTVSWAYSSYKDKMTGEEVNLAVSTGQESLDFKFPYAGKNLPTLTIRKSAKDTAVLLQVEKGQFACLRDCEVAIKFDDKSPVKFTAHGPSDGSSDALFLRPASKIVTSLKTSKIVIVQATFFQEGTRAMTFKTDGLILK